jgi:hypothetical protein
VSDKIKFGERAREEKEKLKATTQTKLKDYIPSEAG